MIVLLHCNHPWNVVKGNSTEAEVSVVGNLADLLNEQVKCGSWGAIDGSDEVRWRKAVVVSGGTATLWLWLVNVKRSIMVCGDQLTLALT